DPVLATSRGGPLWSGELAALLPLLRRATVATPNAAEVAALAGRPVATAAEAEAAGQHLVATVGVAAVLVKGGHLPAQAGQITDLLVTPAGSVPLAHKHLAARSPRGTGCALATALAVELARGQELVAAARRAGAWLADEIARAA